MSYFNVIKIFILSTLSFVGAVSWTPLLTHVMYRFRLGKQIRSEDDAPIMGRLHKKKEGTPTMGGLLIWVTVTVLAVFFFVINWLFPDSAVAGLSFLTRSETLLPLGALVAAALVGLVDDLMGIWRVGPNGGGLKMRHKLLVYLLIAAVGAWWFFFKLDWNTLHVPFLGDFVIGAWYIPIFIFVIAASTFSANEIDGLDGLAGGTLLMAFAAYGSIAFVQGRFDLAAFCGVIIGALLAFLWFNVHPARFIMGDTGSMGLGVTLGIIAMLTNQVLLLPIIALPLVIESFSVIIQVASKKLRKGKKVFLSAPIHHHLEAKGWPEAKIVMRTWIISGVAAVIGIILFLVDRSLF